MTTLKQAMAGIAGLALIASAGVGCTAKLPAGTMERIEAAASKAEAAANRAEQAANKAAAAAQSASDAAARADASAQKAEAIFSKGLHK